MGFDVAVGPGAELGAAIRAGHDPSGLRRNRISLLVLEGFSQREP